MDRVQRTINYYNKAGRNWAEGHTSQSWWLKEIKLFRRLLPRGKVLEIGAGPGRDAKALIDQGYEYVGTDASKEVVKLAKEINPGIEFLQMEAERLDFPADSFDGFWASAVLPHIPKDSIDGVLKKLGSVCKKGAVGFMAMKEGNEEKEEKKTGRWFAFYSEEEFRQITDRNNMETIKVVHKKEPRPNSPDWLVFYVRVK